MTSSLKPHMLLFAAIIMLLVPAAVRADEVLTASPYWQGFTSADGQGLYHDLMRAIYEPGGKTVRHLEVPAKRGLIMVREGAADIYTCRPQAVAGLQLAAEPMYEGEYHAIFRKSAFSDWDGTNSMANKRVVWRLGYYAARDFSVPIQSSETHSGVEALERVVRGGADFYVDDLHLINESIRSSKTPLDENEFRIESVGFRQYFPAFTDSPRGRELLETFERGMRNLSAQGKLAQIYAKWDL
ncbi:MAG: transporter substrate-binding domain-containing protein, partial [Desulfomicrobium sp.]|nr:transporter substrate-binding domain-containing protein [Desulfomicrobium sp.]